MLYIDSFAYNAEGLRISKTVDGVVSKQVYNGQNIVAELNAQNNVTAKYNRGLGLISMDKDGEKMYYLMDGHGSVIRLTNQSGTKMEIFHYDAFGNEQRPNANHTNPFRYCGEYFDKETGNLYLRARYYNSSVGRFTTEDPAFDGINWYVYCANEPVNRMDITGKEWGYICDFTSDLEMLYGGGETKYTPTDNGSVKVQVGGGYFKTTGEFYYNGDAEIKKNGGRSTRREHVGENVDGKLYMDRTDYYRAMGVKYGQMEQTFTVTEGQNHLAGIALGAAVTIATKGASTWTGFGIGAVADYILSQYQREPGEYKMICTTAEVYDPASGLYSSIVTQEVYRKALDEKGNSIWVRADDFVNTKYNGRTEQSMLQ